MKVARFFWVTLFSACLGSDLAAIVQGDAGPLTYFAAALVAFGLLMNLKLV